MSELEVEAMVAASAAMFTLPLTLADIIIDPTSILN